MFCFSFHRAINIPSVNMAVQQVTSRKTRSANTDDDTPLSSPPPPPNVQNDVPKAAVKPKKGQKNAASQNQMDPNKELQIEITKTD